MFNGPDSALYQWQVPDIAEAAKDIAKAALSRGGPTWRHNALAGSGVAASIGPPQHSIAYRKTVERL
jgi:hypothetical protein